MQSNNPVFRRSDGFKSSRNIYGNETYAGNGNAHPGYGNPSEWSVGSPDQPGTVAPPTETGGPMTIDTVVQKTAVSIFLVVLAAFATWVLTPEVTGIDPDLSSLITASAVGGMGAFALSLVNSFKRQVSPALVVLFAVFEGVFIGAFSKVIGGAFGTELVVQAVIGTFAAFGGTLAAYKFFNIQVGSKFRKFTIAAMFGMVGLSVMELILGMFGAQIGLFGLGGLGLLTAIAGLVLGVFMLILDFDFVEQGIANQLPERESWRAAFAITVSLVWIYTNLLRLLAILQSD